MSKKEKSSTVTCCVIIDVAGKREARDLGQLLLATVSCALIELIMVLHSSIFTVVKMILTY